MKQEKVKELQAKLDEHLKASFDREAYEANKALLQDDLADAQTVLTQEEVNRQNIVKAEAKRQEIVALRKTVSDIEIKQTAIDYYRNAKLKANQDAIKSVFQNLTFQFIGESLNGNEQEICDLMIPTDSGHLVKFPWANTANQIKTGIDFCKSYAKAINAETPFILIDNAEAITEDNREFGNDVQVICLVAEREQTIEELEDELPFVNQPREVVNEIIVESQGEQLSFFDGGSV
jgi:hypothetical protein